MKKLTTKQAAVILGISSSRVRQLILSGRLPAEKVGRDLFIKKTDLAMVAHRVTGWPKGRKRK